MTDANVTDLKLNDLFISDTDETKDEKSFSFDKEAVSSRINRRGLNIETRSLTSVTVS